jgi:hypothetical protein
MAAGLVVLATAITAGYMVPILSPVIAYWFQRGYSWLGMTGISLGFLLLVFIWCGVANWSEKRPIFGQGNYLPKRNKFGKLPY